MNIIKQIFEHYLTWFKSHERLVLLLAIGFFGVHFYGKAIDYLVKRDQNAAQIAQKKVEVDAVNNQQLLNQLADLKQQFADKTAQDRAREAQRAADAEKQKKQNDQMTPSDLAKEIAKVLNVKPEEVTASPITEELTFSSSAAHENANALEDLSRLRLDNADLTVELAAANSVIKKEDETIAGLQTALVDEKAARKADVKELKDKNRTSWLHGFKWGVIVGATGVEAIRIFVFHKP